MARRFQQQRRYNELHLLFFLLFVLLILFLTQNGVNAQDSFSNTTCRDIGGGIGHVCLIFEVQGCTSPDLVLHVNRSGSEIYKAVVENGTTYTQTFTPCTATIHIANTPWQLTPTYSHFSYSGAVDCVLFRWTLDPTEVVIGEDCHTHTDCQSCLQSQRCGWCQAGAAGGYVSNQACFAENKAETQPFCGTCSQWYFNDAGTCPGAPPPPHSSSSSSSSTGTAQSSSSTGESGGGTTDDVQSSPALSTGGAVALGFVIGGVILGVGAGFAYYRWRKHHGGRIRVKTDDVSGVELRDGQEPLNDQKSQSDTYEAPRERGNGRNNLPADF